jgi:hypothetical protein
LFGVTYLLREAFSVTQGASVLGEVGFWVATLKRARLR